MSWVEEKGKGNCWKTQQIASLDEKKIKSMSWGGGR